MGKWSDLHPDILSEIIKKIKYPSDHIHCSSICSSWRSIAKTHRPTLPVSVPGLILSTRCSLRRHFTLFPPDFRYHVLDVSPSEACCGSYQGWLALVQETLGSISLYNPFSKTRRFLPKLLDNKKDVYKVVLSSSPSFDPKCVVLILFQTRGAAFCCLNDDSWNFFDCGYLGFSDAVFLDERFYLVDDYGKIYTVNLDDTTIEPIKCQPSDISKLARRKFYLVQLQGQLCRVLRKFKFDEEVYYNCDYDYDDTEEEDELISSQFLTQEFRVIRMDNPVKNGWVSVGDLGGHALFIGCSNSMCLNEGEMSGKMKGNKIYFTDDRQRNSSKHFGSVSPGKDMGVYDATDMSIEPLFVDPWYELMDDPGATWVTPLPW